MMREPDYEQIGQLVLLAQQNNSDAFATLYALTYNKVYNYACHYLRDTYAAQDAVQETYIRALKNINSINEPKLFVSWLNKIAFNVCFDMVQSSNKDATPTDDDIISQILDPNEASNPEYRTQIKNEYKRLYEALDALPFKEQQAVKMKFFNGMKLEDIAKTLGTSRSSVKRYIASGEELLRRSMKD